MTGKMQMTSRTVRNVITDAHYWGIFNRRENRDIPNARQWLLNRLKPFAHDLAIFGVVRIVSKFWKGYFAEDAKEAYKMVKRDTYPFTEEKISKWQEEHRT